MRNNPLLNVDAYKVSHKKMLPKELTKVYSNMTPRSSKHFTFKSSMFDDKVVVFGVQVMLTKLKESWDEDFFSRPLSETLDEYVDVMQQCLGQTKVETAPWEDLHKLGYLPISIKALKEGTRCPMKVPVLTIANTDDRFGWLVNYLETYISTSLWKPMTMATSSYEYKRVLNKYNEETADTKDAMPWQVHDFSARGLGNDEEWSSNAIAHLTSFSGTDTLPAILGAKHYYEADLSVGGSVPATEHAVQTINIALSSDRDKLTAEKNFLKKLITELYPTGIISVVCDSYDFWGVVEQNLPALKDEIMSRDGKLVIRPDSGTPIDVICGTSHYKKFDVDDDELTDWLYDVSDEVDMIFQVGEDFYIINGIDDFLREYGEECTEYSLKEQLEEGQSTISKIKAPTIDIVSTGLLQLLWDIFGGTINAKGYKVLDPHIGIIYGDAITADKYEAILSRMKDMGFSSDNLVIGKGAVGDTLITRDTFGFAVKATHATIDGKDIDVYKNPKTDPNKKSAKGLLHVTKELELIDQGSEELEMTGELKPVFLNGELLNKTTLTNIRNTLDKGK